MDEQCEFCVYVEDDHPDGGGDFVQCKNTASKTMEGAELQNAEAFVMSKAGQNYDIWQTEAPVLYLCDEDYTKLQNLMNEARRDS